MLFHLTVRGCILKKPWLCSPIKVHKLPQNVYIKQSLTESPSLIKTHIFKEVAEERLKHAETSGNTRVRYIIWNLASIGVFGRYEQQEKQGVTGRHQCINHVILFISEEQGWPSNSYVLCNMNGAEKEHRTCPSQGLGSPCHRCQLELIVVIREYCEWEHYCEWGQLRRRAQTEHAQTLKGSI